MADEDRTILRRVPPWPDQITYRPGIECWTATSYSIKPDSAEDFPSWSYADITSPERLIEIEARKRGNMNGWHVVEIRKSQVESLGLRVFPDPTDEDPGHCLIKPGVSGRFTGKVWSKLAKMTRIIYTQPGSME